MSEQQAEALRVATRTLDDLADLVTEDLPTLDQAAHGRVIQDVSETDTQFYRRWTDIKECVDAHLECLDLDESLDSTMYDYVSISGGHPPENRRITLSVRYYPEGRLTTRITLHEESSDDSLQRDFHDNSHSHSPSSHSVDQFQLETNHRSESGF